MGQFWRALKPQSGEVEVLLSRRSKDRMMTKIRELTPRTWGKSFATCIRQVNQSLRGWIEFFQIVTEAEEWELHKLDAHVRRRLRAIKLKHWKRRRTIVRRLIGLGVKAPTAWSVVYHRSKSWWALSGALPVNKALSNAWFRERGLFSLKEHWQEFRTQSVIGPAQLALDLG